ncbi:MAG: Asp-tRNA(Asn)/Glu-tRNA(Gln) amidotransferase subunit GatC [Proteobacteria bacterium]|nr:Asp-tRNA(Asn)/Glu-tRNA(Gln) amidotransferase subunit GatC [Pseudomonadota bacterium]
MSIEVDEVKKIAKLACLNVDDADIQSYATNLSNILDLVAQMDAVDTTGVTPMSHPFDVVQRLREDVVTDLDRREDFQAIAPAVEDGLYLVPKVLE